MYQLNRGAVAERLSKTKLIKKEKKRLAHLFLLFDLLLFRLMTNKLMSEFNMEGKGNKKKRPFKNTKTLELITGS